jgi:preprotein translocase subunit SecD
VAPPAGTLRVGRYFLAMLGIFVVLYSIVALSARHTPKLGLDLVGGVRVIFTTQTPKGSPSVTSAQMTQARQILEDRINSTGVTGATVVVQGSDQLIVEIPNGTSTDVARLGKAAVLNFRGVMAPAQVVSCSRSAASAGSSPASSSTAPSGATSAPSGSTATGSAAVSTAPKTATASGTASNAPKGAAERRLAAPTTASSATPAKPTSAGSGSSVQRSPSATGSASSGATGSAAPSPTATAAATPCVSDPFADLFKADPTLAAKMPNSETCPSPGIAAADCKAYSALSTTQQDALASALRRFDCSAAQVELDIPDRYYVACDTGTNYGATVAYLLGHVVVPGRQIDSASAQAPDVANGGVAWTVSLTLKGSGADSWHAWTSKYNTTDKTANVLQSSATVPCGPSAVTPCSDFVGFTLDGQVISAPVTEAALDVRTSISGNFNSSTASQLAQELNYGKLPVSFRADANQHVSATLGNQQLKAAFLAGGIGLALVVIYSLMYYRGLGLVTIASLLVSAGLTYAMLVILGKQLGFTLDLAGIAGFIVALGITADSFVVFFERLKDEVHDGRSVRVAVPRAWVRARRTILSADTVSFLAAAILYYFAAADVKGFAFTLGMSTILDIVVVFLFTHPIVSLLSRSRTFGSPRFTGLNAVRVGGISTSDEPPRSPARAAARRSSATAHATTATTVTLDKAEPTTDVDSEYEAGPQAEPSRPSERDEPSEPGGEPRRRTAPEPGSAAERAAARRARLRKPADDEDHR